MFNDFELTNKGVALLNRVQAGEGTLQFTKYEIGSGVISGTVKDLTQLVTPFHEFEITRVIRTDDLSTRIQGYFNNTTFVTSHEFRECGIYAQIPGDPTDVLYSYCFDTDPETIPDSSTPYNLTLDDRTYTSDVDNISLEIVEAKDRYDFDTVSDMTLATYIVDGDRIKLWGYYSLGDSGGHERIFSLTDNGTGISFNGGFAIIPDGIEEINLQWFGATGDGVTDDTLKIIQAFDFITSLGGGVIYGNPTSTYRLTHTIFYGDDTTFDGQECTVYHDSNTTNSSAFMPVTFQSDTLWTENVTFKNFTLNGPVGRANGIAGARCRKINLDNIKSDHLHWHIFDGAASREIVIKNCTITSSGTAAFQADNATYPNASEASNAAGDILDIAFVTGGSDWTNTRNMKIMNCDIRGCSVAGVHLHNKNNQNVIITDNHFEGNVRDIYSDDGTDIDQIGLIISNNHFINATAFPIHLLSAHKDLVIEGNRFYSEPYDNTYFYAIYIVGSQTALAKSGVSIDGNQFRGGVRPIIIDGYTSINVTGNSFSQCGENLPTSRGQITALNPQATVRLSGVRNYSVSNNTFDSCRNTAVISIEQGETIASSSTFGNICDNNFASSGAAISIHNTNKTKISGNVYGAGTTPDFVAIYTGIGCSENSLEGNYISSTGGDGIAIEEAGLAKVCNNLFRSNAATGRALIFYNSNTNYSTDNTVISGFLSPPLVAAGTSSNVNFAEPYSPVGKLDTASGQKVDYTKSPL